jgi:hypothetical protein
VLELGLGGTAFTWAFRAIGGRTLDSGSRRCL